MKLIDFSFMGHFGGDSVVAVGLPDRVGSQPDRCARAISWAGSRQDQIPNANQVVDRRAEGEHPADSVDSPVPGLAHKTYGLEPPEDLLHPLARPLAERVARMPRGPAVDGTASPAPGVLRHVRAYPDLTERAHTLPVVEILVHPQGLSMRAGQFLRHANRRFRLRSSACLRQPGVHHKPMPVLHAHMPLVAQLRLGLRALAVKPSLRVSRGLVRGIRALLTPEVHGRIARIIVVASPRLLFGLEALVRSPRLDG